MGRFAWHTWNLKSMPGGISGQLECAIGRILICRAGVSPALMQPSEVAKLARVWAGLDDPEFWRIQLPPGILVASIQT
jgi:hypothetical protein